MMGANPSGEHDIALPDETDLRVRVSAIHDADAATTALEGPSSWLSQLRQDVDQLRQGTLIVRNVDLLDPVPLRGLNAIVRDPPRRL